MRRPAIPRRGRVWVLLGCDVLSRESRYRRLSAEDPHTRLIRSTEHILIIMLRGALVVVFLASSCFAADSPVLVTILTDASKSMHLGGYDRTRFDLVETFHPLQTASVANAKTMAELRQKAEGVKVVTEEETLIPQDGEARLGSSEFVAQPALPSQKRVVFGDWTEWTAWTGCANGERYRLRTCVSRRPALKVVCHGPNKEVQRCYSSSEHHVLVAEDPWTIEREISGDFKA